MHYYAINYFVRSIQGNVDPRPVTLGDMTSGHRESQAIMVLDEVNIATPYLSHDQ